MFKLFQSTLFLCVFFFYGCVTPNVKEDFSLAKNNMTGVVVGSLTKTGYGHWPPGYNYEQIDGNKSGNFNFNANMFERIISDFDGIDGKLLVVELPVGEYQIFRWYTDAAYVNKASIKRFSIRFTVTPGEITYIGELNMNRESGGLLGISIGNVVLDVKESMERDLKRAISEYPRLDFSNIKKSLMREVNIN